MSARSTIELAGASIAVVAGILAVVFWIQAGDAEAAQRAVQAVEQHELSHVAVNTAIIGRLHRLERMADSTATWQARKGVLLESLDRRTDMILKAVME